MPLGGANVLWDETSPPDTEVVGLGDDRVRSTKTSVRNGLDSEHNWPAAGGASTGYHRYGSARPFYIAQSLVSSSGTDARLALTSDSSRLFGVGSGGTMLLGDPGMLSVASIVWPQRAYWVAEVGYFALDGTGGAVVTYPNSGFSGVPITHAQVDYTNASGVTRAVVVSLRNPGATSIGMYALDAASNSTVSATGTVGGAGGTVRWVSIGTRTL